MLSLFLPNDFLFIFVYIALYSVGPGSYEIHHCEGERAETPSGLGEIVVGRLLVGHSLVLLSLGERSG